MKLALQWLRGPNDEKPQRERAKWPVAATAAVAALLAFVAAALLFRQAKPRDTIRFTIVPPAGSGFPSLGEGGGFALSPDGRRIVFSATTLDGRSFLWLRDFAAGEARQLRSTEGAEYPFWSPQGDAIAFFAAGKLKRMSLPEGPPQTICDATSASRRRMEPRRRHSLRAEQQGRSVPHRGGRRNAPGGARPRCANLLALLARLPARPEAFPDVCAGVGCAEERHLVRLPRRAARRKPVIATTGSVALPADDLLYVRDGVLVRQRFDAKDQQLIGETSTLADGMIF